LDDEAETATIRGMNARRARRVAHGLWLATGVLWVATFALVFAGSPTPGSVLTLVLIATIPMAIYASVGALVARSSPDNPIGWLLMWIGLAVAIWMFTVAYAQIGVDPGEAIGGLPAALPIIWLGVLALPGGTPVVLPLLLLIFPGGRLRSRRWRPVLWIACLGGALMLFGALWMRWDLDPVVLSPLIGNGEFDLFLPIGLLIVVLTSFAGVLALILRFREAGPEQQQPLRLLVWVLVAMAAATAVALAVNLVPSAPDWLWFLMLIAIIVDGAGILFGIPLAATAAVLTFGLYDVGVVIKKTVVYVALVVVFLVVLGLVVAIFNPLAVVGTGSSGTETEAKILRIVSIGSVTLLVLVLAFRPVKRLARRLVYGRRSTPYEAMSEFSERLGEAYSTVDVLPRMASILRASTGADVARVWLHVGRELRPVASAPADASDLAPLVAHGDDPPVVGGIRLFPVRDQGELLGALTVEMPPAEPLSRTGEQLVIDVAGQAGLVLRNVRLVEELQESRRRIVTAQDERARKLERDIHDGAQQQLVALSVKMRLVDQLVERDPAKAHELIGQIQDETTDALETLRELARGIYPPLLADKGLVAALEAQGRKVAVPVTVHADGVGRFDRDVEAGVYFCVLEALNNVSKYADATRVDIRLSNGSGALWFEVGDDGIGFDASAGRGGTGLQGMTDRLSALGGTLEVRSAPGSGTVVLGSVPTGTNS
jgi:signal transduction histidine kinase